MDAVDWSFITKQIATINERLDKIMALLDKAPIQDNPKEEGKQQ